MIFQSARFGEIEFATEDVVTLSDGLLGFEENTRYVVLQHGDGGPFRWLQSIEDANLAFLIVDPAYFVPEYAPLLENSQAQALGLTEGTPRLVYTIVTIPKGKPEEMTLNLAGPIVINAQTRMACQVIVEDESCSVRHRVFEKAKTEEPVAA